MCGEERGEEGGDQGGTGRVEELLLVEYTVFCVSQEGEETFSARPNILVNLTKSRMKRKICFIKKEEIQSRKLIVVC